MIYADFLFFFLRDFNFGDPLRTCLINTFVPKKFILCFINISSGNLLNVSVFPSNKTKTYRRRQRHQLTKGTPLLLSPSEQRINLFINKIFVGSLNTVHYGSELTVLRGYNLIVPRIVKRIQKSTSRNPILIFYMPFLWSVSRIS